MGQGADVRCPSLKEWGRDIGMRCPSYRSGETSPVSRSHYQNHLTRRKCFLVKRLAAHPKFVELRKIRDERSGGGGGGFKKKQGGGVGTPLPLPFNSNSKSNKAA